LLTPGHQLLARKPRVAAQDDLHLRPTAADLIDQARDLVDGAGRSIDVGAPQPSAQQVRAAEDIERQVAVAAVVAVEEAALLLPMERIVGRVQVQDDLLRGLLMSRQKNLDQKAVHGFGIDRDLPYLSWATAPHSSRFKVLLPASGLPRSCSWRRSLPVGSALPTIVASKGSVRSSSWSLRSS